LVKASYFLYDTIIHYDNVYFCPTSGLLPPKDIKCVKCPENGDCDDKGNLI